MNKEKSQHCFGLSVLAPLSVFGLLIFYIFNLVHDMFSSLLVSYPLFPRSLYLLQPIWALYGLLSLEFFRFFYFISYSNCLISYRFSNHTLPKNDLTFKLFNYFVESFYWLDHSWFILDIHVWLRVSSNCKSACVVSKKCF